MAVTLAESDTVGFLALAFPYESGGMVGSQAIVGIPQYNMIVKYERKWYSYQVALPYKQNTLMDASA